MKNKFVSPAKKTPDIFDDAAISGALEKYLELSWTKQNQKAIRREIGPGNYSRIEEILSFASNQDAWLNANNLSAAADIVSGKLSQRYPRLSPLAVFKIVNHTAYGWR